MGVEQYFHATRAYTRSPRGVFSSTFDTTHRMLCITRMYPPTIRNVRRDGRARVYDKVPYSTYRPPWRVNSVFFAGASRD
jgi:hypothetical protein